MNRRPPRLSALRLLAGLVLPLVACLIIRAVTGSSVGALAITDAVPSTGLIVIAIARRRVDPIAVLSATTVMPERILIAQVPVRPPSADMLGAAAPWRSETDTGGLASRHGTLSHPYGRCLALAS